MNEIDNDHKIKLYHENEMTGPWRSIRALKSDTLGMFSLVIKFSHIRASLDVLARAARNPPPPAPANVTPRTWKGQD